MTPTLSPAPETIRLASGATVLIDATDRADLLARGYTNAWFVVLAGGRGAVKTKLPGTTKPVAIARLILAPPEAEKVTYRDGDPMNLQRSNLVLSSVLRAEVADTRPAPPPRPSRPPRPPTPPRAPSVPRPAKTATDAAAAPKKRADRKATREAKERAALIKQARDFGVSLPPGIAATLTPKEAATLPADVVPETTLLDSVQRRYPRDLAAQMRYLLEIAATLPAPAAPPLPDGLAEAMARPARCSLDFLHSDKMPSRAADYESLDDPLDLL